ncbi:hypothetical protein [Glycomyces sp. NPDC021274]|uniref:hypothetical protein n=1 Tax=Glycomyces sp. NPDC021274 TaxID=3155120 RepID=UPI0033F43021
MARLFGRKNQEPTNIPTYDPTLGDPAAARLMSDMTRRDWRAVHNFLSVIQDPDHLQYYLNLCVKQNGVQAWIDDWIEAEPRSFLPYLVGGAHAVKWAWLGRGIALAKDTLPAQFKIFERRLRKAHILLTEAIARNHDDPTAWAALIPCAMGMSLGLEEATRRYQEAVARHRWHLSAHQHLHNQYLKKWGGSHELAYRFAEETAAVAPSSSGLATLVVTSHLEEWVRLGTGVGHAGHEYLNSPATLASLHAAADNSVRHPDYRRRLGWQYDHNSFAMAFWATDQWDAAGEMFDQLGDQVTEVPWDYYAGEPAKRFAWARDKVNRHRSDS